MTDAPALILRRLVVRAGSAAEAEAVASGFKAGMLPELAGMPTSQGGSSIRLQLTGSASDTGSSAAAALRQVVTGGHHG